MSSDSPIGVFDSGVGGLTVAQRLLEVAPEERIYYFADTGYVPYGPRPLSQIRQFALDICSFLAEQGVKMIVMGCNMSSGVALEPVREKLGLPALGTVQAGARAAAAATRNGRIGVLATEGAVGGRLYSRALERHDVAYEVRELACPEFVPIVEAGPTGPPERETIRQRLAPLRAAGVDTVVLGCTHYPLIADEIRAALDRPVTLVDPAESLAREAADLLDRLNLRRQSPPAEHRFWASGDEGRLAELAEVTLGQRPGQVVRLDVHSQAE
ncbi:MAG: glutamate racemase [Armatimonadota bacterium]